MSINCTRLCSKIVHEHFGNIVGRVAEVLLTRGSKCLNSLVKELDDIPKAKIKDALGVLIQFNLVSFGVGRHKEVLYNAHVNNVLYMVRYVRYLIIVKNIYGTECEMIIDSLLREGQAPASTIIVNGALKIAQLGTYNLKELHIIMKNKFIKLVTDKFIQRCPEPIVSESPIPELAVDDKLLYYFPEHMLDLKALQERIANVDSEKYTYGDEKILWKINFDQLNIEIRDNEIKNAIAKKYELSLSDNIQTLLKNFYTKVDPWVHEMPVITLAEIKTKIQSNYLEQYFRILDDDGDLIKRIGDAGGGEYKFSMASMCKALTHSVVDSIIQDRHGSKAARIFRLIRDNEMIEVDLISEKAMISKKDANTITFQLFCDNFLQMYEVRKSNLPSQSNKNIYLYYINMESVVRKLLERSYFTMYNLMSRRFYTINEHKRLLDKQSRIEVIIGNLRASGADLEEQIKEVEELLSHSEKQAAKQASTVIDKLYESEYSLDESIFIFQMYMYYK